MKSFTAWIVILTALLAGCAQSPIGGSNDSERLHNAIAIDDVGFVESAVKSGSLSVNSLVRTPGFREGAPIVVVAARYGSLKTLGYLISAGADINARTASGETALMMASYFKMDESARSSERHERAVRMLVEAGASLENEWGSYTPLAYAAYQGNDRIVRYLIERGARVDGGAQDGVSYVNTPLMMAAIQGHAETTMWLLRAGANARVRVFQGHTASELAVRYNHSNLMAALRCAETLSPGEAFAQRCAGR